MPTLQRAPSCFGPSNLYLDGEWRLDHPQPALPYRLRKEELSKWLNKENASYPGACHEHPHTPPPQQYQWQPRACSLRLRDRSAACMALRGMHVLFVGDSIAEQQFNSYSHLLGADFSRNSTRFQTRWIRRSGNRSRWGRDEGRMEALACDGHVRIGFVRSDLLAWYASRSDLRDMAGFRLFPVSYDFRRAAVAADVVVVGGGQHFVGPNPPFVGPVKSIWNVGPMGAPGLLWNTFFEQGLNDTLSHLLAARAAKGRPSSSVVLLSTTSPVPNCWVHTEPGDYSNSLLAKPYFYWGRQHRALGPYRAIGRDVASRLGASFLDIYHLAELRPDAAKARYNPLQPNGVDNSTRDCVHMCLPGPPDEWSYLLINLIVERVSPLTLPRSGAPENTRGDFSNAHERKNSFDENSEYAETALGTHWWFPFENANNTRIARQYKECERCGLTKYRCPRRKVEERMAAGKCRSKGKHG